MAFAPRVRVSPPLPPTLPYICQVPTRTNLTPLLLSASHYSCHRRLLLLSNHSQRVYPLPVAAPLDTGRGNPPSTPQPGFALCRTDSLSSPWICEPPFIKFLPPSYPSVDLNLESSHRTIYFSPPGASCSVISLLRPGLFPFS